MHQNLATILQQFNYCKNTFIVFIPGLLSFALGCPCLCPYHLLSPFSVAIVDLWLCIIHSLRFGAGLHSVTIFDVFSPLWLTIIVLWPFRRCVFSIWQNFELILANFICYWANFNCCKWPNTEQTIYPSGHTGSTYLFKLLSSFLVANSGRTKSQTPHWTWRLLWTSICPGHWWCMARTSKNKTDLEITILNLVLTV